MTEAQSGLRLSTLCNQCRADTDRFSIGSTVSGRPHELRLSSKNTAHGAYLHDYCPRGTPPTGWTHETSPAGTCSKAAFVWRVCVFQYTIVATQPGAFCRLLGMYHHLCTSEMLDMVLHTCIHAYIHHLDHLSDLRSGLSMSTTMSLLMSSRACGLTSVTFARA